METLTAIALAFVGGGGLVSVVNWFKNWKLTKKQEKQTDARTDEMVVNTLSKALETVNKQIVEPLKNELLREQDEKSKILNKLNNEITKLRKAIEKIPGCDHASSCPVSKQLQDYKNSD
jgi:hypothetical protein